MTPYKLFYILKLSQIESLVKGEVAMYEGMIAETVGIRGHNDDLIEGYLARPLGGGPFPGVVVIHLTCRAGMKPPKK